MIVALKSNMTKDNKELLKAHKSNDFYNLKSFNQSDGRFIFHPIALPTRRFIGYDVFCIVESVKTHKISSCFGFHEFYGDKSELKQEGLSDSQKSVLKSIFYFSCRNFIIEDFDSSFEK